MQLSWIDIGIVLIFVISVVIAIFRGFVKEAVSLASWIIAIWLAVTFADQVALFLPSNIDDATINFSPNELEVSKLRLGIAFTLIVVGTLIAGSLLNYILSHVTQASVIKGIDRILGMGFGFLRGGAIVILLILLASFTTIPKSDIWQASNFLPPFETVARQVIKFMPAEYSKFFILEEDDVQVSLY